MLDPKQLPNRESATMRRYHRHLIAFWRARLLDAKTPAARSRALQALRKLNARLSAFELVELRKLGAQPEQTV